MAILGIGKKKNGMNVDTPSSRQASDAAAVGLGLAALPAAPLVGAGILGKKVYDALSRDSMRPIKQRKEMLAADVARMRDDPNSLGMSDAEREKYIGDATRAAGASQQAQLQQLTQAALAGTPQAQSALLGAQQQILGAGDDAAVKAASEANSLHRQMVDREVARIRGELDAQAERAKENTRYWLNFGFTAAGALISAATGGGAGIAASAAGLASNPPGGQTAPPPPAPDAAPAPPPAAPAPARDPYQDYWVAY